jgi:hypothetical protein
MIWHAPQIMLGLLCARPSVNLALHGQQKRGKYNVLDALVTSALTATVLHWGGFW